MERINAYVSDKTDIESFLAQARADAEGGGVEFDEQASCAEYLKQLTGLLNVALRRAHDLGLTVDLEAHDWSGLKGDRAHYNITVRKVL